MDTPDTSLSFDIDNPVAFTPAGRQDTSDIQLSLVRETQHAALQNQFLTVQASANEGEVLSPKMKILIGSMPEIDQEQFVSSCSPEDVIVFERMTSPQVCEIDGQYHVVDTAGTVHGLDFAATIAALQAMGLELLDDASMEKFENVAWTWLQPKKRPAPKKGNALGGDRCRGRSAAGVYVVESSDSSLAGCGLKRVQKKF